MSALRITREAALLKGVSSDNTEEVSVALGISEEDKAPADAKELLTLRVKPTFNDARNSSAFFHSIASYGMEFGLNETITQLAHRNEKTHVLKLLLALEKSLGLSSPRTDLDLEQALLEAVANDQGTKITGLLQSAEDGEMLLNLQVKDTYQDPHDHTAFYHSVASHGLKFELGDTFHGLAVRNERPSAAASLTSFTARPPGEVTELELLVTNAVNGKELCRLSALSTWTILDVAREVSLKAPSPGGCRVFLQGSAALTTGTTLADLTAEKQLELSSLVRSNVDGIYTARVVPPDVDDDHPLLGGRRLGRMGRRRPVELQMELKNDGTVIFECSEKPIDRGHCAPPSGGYLLSGSGTWAFDGPGVKVVINDGTTGHFVRCMPQSDKKLRKPFTLTLAMVKEDQLDLVNKDDKEQRTEMDRFMERGFSCPVGTAFLKRPAGEAKRPLVTFR